MIAIQPRKTILKLEYNDTDISGDISGDVESFTYNDRGADSSDSIFDDGKPKSVFDHVHQHKGIGEVEREVLHGQRDTHAEQIFRSGDESFRKQSGRVTA